MPKINKIKLSGTSYDIQDSNASKTVTLTQAQYDALQTKDPNTFYIISDGETFDPSEKVDTSAFTAYSASVETALSGKAAQSDLNTLSGTVTGHTGDTTIHVTASDKATWNAKSDFSGSYNDLTNKLSAGTNITIVDNVINAEGGGGKAVSGGTNISITTGETADTINCTIPAYFGTNTKEANIRIGTNITNGDVNDYSLLIGRNINKGGTGANYKGIVALCPAEQNDVLNNFYGRYLIGIGRKVSFGVGISKRAEYSVGIGDSITVYGNGNVAIGALASTSGTSSVAIGSGTTANGSDYKMNLNNQIKVTPSNQVYIYNKDNTEMICLQDQLGGGGGITSGDVQSMIDESISGKTDESAFTAHTADTTIHVTSSDKTTWSGKQDALISGTNIKTINNESILGSGNITIQGGGGSSVIELTQAEYDALTTIDPDTIYVITDAAGGDLSNYYTKAQINAMIGDIESLLAAI